MKKFLFIILMIALFVIGGRFGIKTITELFTLKPTNYFMDLIITGVCIISLIALARPFQRVLNED